MTKPEDPQYEAGQLPTNAANLYAWEAQPHKKVADLCAKTGILSLRVGNLYLKVGNQRLGARRCHHFTSQQLLKKNIKTHIKYPKEHFGIGDCRNDHLVGDFTNHDHQTTNTLHVFKPPIYIS